MKILEPQSAILSNYEVFAHVTSVREQSRPNPHKHRNVETVLKEVTDYLSPANSSAATLPSPLPPYTAPHYSKEHIHELTQRLKPFIVSRSNPSGLYKNEVLMIVNMRPHDLGLLDCMVEECDERFSEGQQAQILEIVGSVLGRGDGKGEGEVVNGNGGLGERHKSGK